MMIMRRLPRRRWLVRYDRGCRGSAATLKARAAVTTAAAVVVALVSSSSGGIAVRALLFPGAPTASFAPAARQRRRHYCFGHRSALAAAAPRFFAADDDDDDDRSPSPASTSLRTTTSTSPTTTRDDEEEDSLSSSWSQDDVWESLASSLFSAGSDDAIDNDDRVRYVQAVSLLRVGIPSLFMSVSAKIAYPVVAMTLAAAIHDAGVFAVVSQDASQYIQNVLTTSGLVFSLLVGQTYYFMYQQQEAIYLALFEEVTMAKSLLEQVALVSQGRESLYGRILKCIDLYVQDDLKRFNDVEPAFMLSGRPVDDPLEDILYLTSVGEPSVVYQTVRSLRQARARRLGALQRKLPDVHMALLWVLAAIVLFTFPLLGAGSQTIGGAAILAVQSWYLSFIVFGMSITMGVVYELQKPGRSGAYNALTVLQVMVSGLQEELDLRLKGEWLQQSLAAQLAGPSVDGDGGGVVQSSFPDIDAAGSFMEETDSAVR